MGEKRAGTDLAQETLQVVASGCLTQPLLAKVRVVGEHVIYACAPQPLNPQYVENIDKLAKLMITYIHRT